MWRYVFFYMLVLSSTDFYCLSSLSCPRNHSLQTMNHPQGLLMLKLKTGRVVSDNSLDTLKCSHCKGKAISYQTKTPLTCTYVTKHQALLQQMFVSGLLHGSRNSLALLCFVVFFCVKVSKSDCEFKGEGGLFLLNSARSVVRIHHAKRMVAVR